MNDSLTIIIPYFKLRYLKAALDSIAAQTNRDFKVFIGDDASPEDPTALLDTYRGTLHIDYHRFPENLGGQSLTRHWDRCVRMTNTPWLWLFSDDDLMSPECVESFYEGLRATGSRYDVYRFNIEVIDGEGLHIHTHKPHPESETVREYALELYKMARSSVAVEHLFRRSVFDRAGGFVEFPLAWFSDHASWMTFGRETGFYTLSRGKVQWRNSGLNLSSRDPSKFLQKLQALRLYLCWLELNFRDPVFQREIHDCMGTMLPNIAHFWGGPPGLVDGIKFWWFFSGFTGRPQLHLLREFLGLAGFKAKFRRWIGMGAPGKTSKT